MSFLDRVAEPSSRIRAQRGKRVVKIDSIAGLEMLRLEQQHDLRREIRQSPQWMKSHPRKRHRNIRIAPKDPIAAARLCQHHLERRLRLARAIRINLMNRQFKLVAATPLDYRPTIRRHSIRMRYNFLQ